VRDKKPPTGISMCNSCAGVYLQDNIWQNYLHPCSMQRSNFFDAVGK